MTTDLVDLGEFMVRRQPSVNPALHPNEAFHLFSIPAYDSGVPDLAFGADIGSSKKAVEPGDVLLSRIVPHIRRAWVVPECNGRRQIASSEWLVFRSAVLCPRYLCHFLTSDPFHSQYMNTVAGVGGSLLRARPDSVAKIQIPLPPLEEQKRIAAILDKADAIRRKRMDVETKTVELEDALFLDGVGPGANGYSNWTIKSIEALAAPHKCAMRTGPFGSDLLHSEFVDNGVAVLGIDNAVKNRFCWDERRYISPRKYDELQRYTVYPGDVIITIMGTIGRSAVVPDDIPTAITTKHIATITLNRNLAEPEFISQAIHRHPHVAYQLGLSNRGAIMAGLNLGIIKRIELPIPPMKVQREFVKGVNRIRQLRKNQLVASQQSDDLFQSLVQRAFRGEL